MDSSHGQDTRGRRQKRPRMSSLALQLTVMTMLESTISLAPRVGAFSTAPSHAHLLNGWNRPACVHESRSSCLFSTTTKYEFTQQELQSMKVAELKQLVKESEWNRRGLLTSLSRKQDLVDFLDAQINGETNIPQSDSSTDKSSTNAHSDEVARSPEIKKEAKKPRYMPPLNPPPPPLSIAVPAASGSKNNEPLSPKEAVFQRVYDRYPPVGEETWEVQRYTALANGEPIDDVRQTYHPMFASNGQKLAGDMDIVFIGTASCVPSTTRGVSCTALRLNWKRQAVYGLPKGSSMPPSFAGGTWIFDCGECTQLQVQRTTAIRPSKITKIFLTHAHGDHSFGLPGLLCLMGQDRDRDGPPVDIYGPEGLRMWLRVAIRYSVSRIVPPYRVHELKDIPMAPEWEFNSRTRKYFYRAQRAPSPSAQPTKWPLQGVPGEDPLAWITKASMMPLEASSLYGETEGGRDIFPDYDHRMSSDGAPVWDVEDEGDVKVYAAPMSHGIPCVGYVVEEADRPGRLRDELVKPLVLKNADALRESGFRAPLKALGVIKNLAIGSAFTFPDGTVLTQEEAVAAPRKGRKVVICGDTASTRSLDRLAENADVIIHEATNTYLAGVDPKESNLRELTRDTIYHGHSTPFMAGDFAKRVNAKRLLMNHFSPRYRGDASVESLSIMLRVEFQAMKASGLSESEVAAAWDLMLLPIPLAEPATTPKAAGST